MLFRSLEKIEKAGLGYSLKFSNYSISVLAYCDDLLFTTNSRKDMKKEGGGKWDFQLVLKRVEVAMPVTAEDDDELTTANKIL